MICSESVLCDKPVEIAKKQRQMTIEELRLLNASFYEKTEAGKKLTLLNARAKTW